MSRLRNGLRRSNRAQEKVTESWCRSYCSYGAEYRGLIQYYLLAGDVWRLDQLEWAAKTSMLKTLGAKRDSTVSKMAHKYKTTTILTPYGPRRCFEASVERPGRKPRVARFGGILLKLSFNLISIHIRANDEYSLICPGNV